MTLDKGHRKNLVTSYPLQKDTIHQIEIAEPRDSKPHYKGSDNSYTEHSHGEEKNENYQYMDELSNKDKEDGGYSE